MRPNPKLNNKKKILVVDDDDNLRQSLKAGLEEQGFKIFLASDGEEGFEKAKENLPDLILLNIMMPKMDGMMTTLKLKGEKETRHIPVLIMSGIREKEERILSHNVGAADYLIKPFTTEQLLEKIHKLLLGK